MPSEADGPGRGGFRLRGWRWSVMVAWSVCEHGCMYAQLLTGIAQTELSTLGETPEVFHATAVHCMHLVFSSSEGHSAEAEKENKHPRGQFHGDATMPDSRVPWVGGHHCNPHL